MVKSKAASVNSEPIVSLKDNSESVKDLFRSFWMGGYECSDKLNKFRQRVDLLAETRHLDFLDEDYESLKKLNILTVREGIRWSQVEKSPYRYDWTAVSRMIEAGQRHGIQQMWDICHFGFPDGLTPLSPAFARRFEALCKEFAMLFRSLNSKDRLIVTPINEVSFLSWLGGDVQGTSPFCTGRGADVKYGLMRAYIRGIKAMRAIDSETRIVPTEPMINITHDIGASARKKAEAARHNEYQFEAFDILIGKMHPELGGRPDYLDVMGVNFYYDNQWVLATRETVGWHVRDEDERWLSLHQLFQRIYERYQKPLLLTETSHPKEDRPVWLQMVTKECIRTLEAGIPFLGICWYPIIDRPDWNHLHLWHQSGIWDRAAEKKGEYVRVLHQPTAEELLKSQHTVAQYFATASRSPKSAPPENVRNRSRKPTARQKEIC